MLLDSGHRAHLLLWFLHQSFSNPIRHLSGPHNTHVRQRGSSVDGLRRCPRRVYASSDLTYLIPSVDSSVSFYYWRAGALKATGNRGLQPAMDHLVENEGKPVPDLASVSASAPAPGGGGGGSGPMDVDGEEDEDLAALRAVYGKQAADGSGAPSSSADAGGAEAKSIKCSVCGKTFKNVDLANYHAEKSGHDQFEESTEEVRRAFHPSLASCPHLLVGHCWKHLKSETVCMHPLSVVSLVCEAERASSGR